MGPAVPSTPQVTGRRENFSALLFFSFPNQVIVFSYLSAKGTQVPLFFSKGESGEQRYSSHAPGLE